ncbi:hypothetical protein ABES25_09110 [Bacillus gobiensis]|nr:MULTISPECIES: hypothetical protein [Bacillus]MED1097522.1 hypothetical protein [Bacillus capparidis]
MYGNGPNKRIASIGHGYASMPHSFKHGYGNPYRLKRLQAIERANIIPPYWY